MVERDRMWRIKSWVEEIEIERESMRIELDIRKIDVEKNVGIEDEEG